ncbi:hypothetical protein DPMN_180801 [Dreissena polymorpha]|uniref:Uncharacterized protein n=1 Tax=Dreissena polymorpha TaxID=45954 RepID=A0A9D4I361_DREPO|nr:hypothetical protein DPMN_180801 [Dreissena polymorpha]
MRIGLREQRLRRRLRRRRSCTFFPPGRPPLLVDALDDLLLLKTHNLAGDDANPRRTCAAHTEGHERLKY